MLLRPCSLQLYPLGGYPLCETEPLRWQSSVLLRPSSLQSRRLPLFVTSGGRVLAFLAQLNRALFLRLGALHARAARTLKRFFIY